MKVDLEKLAKVISAELDKKPLTKTQTAKIVSTIIGTSVTAAQYWVNLLQKNYGFEFVKDERKHLRGKAANNRGETLALQKNEKVETILLALKVFNKSFGMSVEQYRKENLAESFYRDLNGIIARKLKKNHHANGNCLREFIKRNKIKII
jgi:hypothetical protein